MIYYLGFHLALDLAALVLTGIALASSLELDKSDPSVTGTVFGRYKIAIVLAVAASIDFLWTGYLVSALTTR